MTSINSENSEITKKLLEQSSDIVFSSISHGYYMPIESEFEVPDNIILQQYSPPGYSLTVLEATHIKNKHFNSKSLDKVKPFYLIQKDGVDSEGDVIMTRGNIYYSNLKNFITPPGSKTLNIQLDFSDNKIGNTKLSVENNKGKKIEIQGKTTLKDLLEEISTRLKQEEKSPEIYRVIQLSCRSGLYNTVEPNDYELLRAFDRCYSQKSYIEMQYIGKDYFEKKDFYLTEDEHFAKQISCLIKNNFPLSFYEASEDLQKKYQKVKKDYYEQYKNTVKILENYSVDEEGDVHLDSYEYETEDEDEDVQMVGGNKIKLHNNKTRKNKRNKKSIKFS